MVSDKPVMPNQTLFARVAVWIVAATFLATLIGLFVLVVGTIVKLILGWFGAGC